MNTNPYAAPHAELADIRSYGDDPYDRLATRWQRFGGSIVDGIAQSFSAPFTWAVQGLLGVTGAATAFKYLPSMATTGAIVFGGIVALVLLAIDTFLLARNGQTIGKLVAGTKIVRSDGSKADVARILLLRGLPVLAMGFIPIPFIAALGGLAIWVDILMIFRNDKRCLHDHIADTIVVTA